MIGQLSIKMYVRRNYPDGSYTLRPTRVATYDCEHGECDSKIAEFARANPELWQAVQRNIYAEWVGRDLVRCP